MVFRSAIRVLFLLAVFLGAGCQALEVPPTVVPDPTLVPTPVPTATATATAVPTALPAISETPEVTAEPPPADLRSLQAVLEESLASFDGFSSYVVVDLQSGDRIARNDEVALAGMSLIKVPILINTYRELDGPPTIEQTKLITQTTALSSNFAANLLLQTIAGKPDAFAGADIVSQSMRDLGIYNTFIAVPIEADPRPDRLNTYLTPANQRTDITTYADPYRQTTTGDLAKLFKMIYECAEEDGGPLRERYGPAVTAAECQDMLAKMQLNELATLLENGLPEGTLFSHKVGWIDDTHADGGIVNTPGGNYIIVMALYAPEWLEWEISAPLFKRVSELTYAHFNDPDAYVGLDLPPLPTPAPATPTPDLVHAVVTNTGGVGLTIRDQPGGEEVAIVPEGSILALIDGQAREGNGLLWYFVRAPGGEEGWAAGDYFTIWEE